MTKIKMVKRTFNRKLDTVCKCGEIIEKGHPEYALEMPYCSYCGKIILDINQNYCCWCGQEIED